MKRIFCPRCDTTIVITNERLEEIKADGGRFAIVCPGCNRQLRARLRRRDDQNNQQPENEEEEELQPRISAPARLRILENQFCHPQVLHLWQGSNSIGRRNKDSVVDHPILTGDPSMDRQHCIITARKGEGDNGAWNYVLTDNDSRVGTFLFGRILEPKEQVNLSDGDIITLGATTLIFAEEGSDGGEGEQEKNE